MSKHSQYKKHYFDFMKDIIKGHDEKVPSSDLMVDDGKRKDKIRIAFDCSAKFQGTAPNDHLLQGPDLTNTLVGVLFRFRHRTNVPSVQSERWGQKLFAVSLVGKWELLLRSHRISHVCTSLWGCFIPRVCQFWLKTCCRWPWGRIWYFSSKCHRKKLLCWWRLEVCPNTGWSYCGHQKDHRHVH